MSARVARAWSRVRRTPGFGRDVLTLVLTVAVGLGVTGFLLVQQRAQLPWAEDYTFHAEFQEAPAISPGNGQEVRIAGVPVGEIAKAEVSEDGEADLTMVLEPEYTVYKDARLVLRPKSPLNEMYVELDPGTASAGELPDGETLPATRTGSTIQQDEVFQHLDGRTRAAVTTLLAQSDAALASMPTSLAPGLRSTDETLAGLGKVSDALASRRAALARLVTDLGTVAQAVGNDDTRLATLARDAAETLNALDDKNAQFDQTLATLPGFMKSLRSSTTKITQLSSQLQPTLSNIRSASGRLPGALSGLQDTLAQLADLSTEAGPLVREARPLVADLRPFVGAGNRSLVAITPFTGRLDTITQRMISSLDYRREGELGYLQDFLANTTSVGSLSDGNGGIFRAEFVESPGALVPTRPKGKNQ
jgi:phospholipid/cholesterol/gamma-HCH transport system substrate-binding protein